MASRKKIRLRPCSVRLISGSYGGALPNGLVGGTVFSEKKEKSEPPKRSDSSKEAFEERPTKQSLTCALYVGNKKKEEKLFCHAFF